MIRQLVSKRRTKSRKYGKLHNNVIRKFLCTLKGTEPQEEMFEIDEAEEEILPEPTIDNLSYIAREIRPVIVF